MVFRAAFVLFSAVAFAQTAPPDVDQALRARVNEFFQFHVDGNFRKAYELVADDSKDYYFAAQKVQFKSFKIDKIDYLDNFTKATVTLTCERMWRIRIQLPETLVTLPVTSLWKLEHGKWAYFHDAQNEWITPMGPSSAKTPPSNTSGQIKMPNLSRESIAEAAQNSLKKAGVDKSDVTLATDKASADQVVFHNGQLGPVRLTLDPGPKVKGLTVELDKTDVNGGDNALIKLRYAPSPEGDDALPSSPIVVRVFVAPFNQTVPITVKFASPAKH